MTDSVDWGEWMNNQRKKLTDRIKQKYADKAKEDKAKLDKAKRPKPK